MDQFLDLDSFPILNSSKTEEKVLKSIRLLSVFSNNMNNKYSVIFATNDDIVYGFGDNTNGCLGLGEWTHGFPVPQENRVLSHKKLVDIAVGHQHFLALTVSGQVYAWGQNNFGELGIGRGDGRCTPCLVRELVGMEVVQISCGSSFSMALSSYKHLYAWGRNSYNQLGLGSLSTVWLPRKVMLKDRIASISCGRITAMALTDTGKVYVWGVFKCGQSIVKANHGSESSGPPAILPGFEDMIITKAICGTNFSLLLTSEGRVYSFGNNYDGQVGKGAFGTQAVPIRIGEHIQFKDVIASTFENLSVGISKDNEYFVWGFVENQRIFSPKRVTDPSFRSVFDVYAKLARKKVTFKTIVLDSIDNNKYLSTKRSPDINDWLNKSDNHLNNCLQTVSPKNDIIVEKNFETNEERVVKKTPEKSTPKTASKNCSQSSIITNNVQSVITQTSEPFSEKVFHNFLIKSFNNPEDYDLKLIFKDKIIYCHKTVLKFRNKQFWQKCKNQFKNGNKNEIRIKPIYYNSLLAFLQHLYGQTPEVNEQNCWQLLELATIYNEEELKDLCAQFLSTRIDVSKVLPFIEKAVES